MGLIHRVSRLAGSDEEEEEGEWKLYFKLYCFLDVDSVPKEGVEFAFMFEQVSPIEKYDKSDGTNASDYMFLFKRPTSL